MPIVAKEIARKYGYILTDEKQSLEKMIVFGKQRGIPVGTD